MQSRNSYFVVQFRNCTGTILELRRGFWSFIEQVTFSVQSGNLWDKVRIEYVIRYVLQGINFEMGNLFFFFLSEQFVTLYKRYRHNVHVPFQEINVFDKITAFLNLEIFLIIMNTLSQW